MIDWATWIPGLLLGIALSAGSGFRIFIPLLVSNVATKLGWIHLSENFAWMGSNTATIVFAVATFVEIGSYYIPFVDNLLDSLAIPVSMIAGTILTTQFLTIEDPLIQWGLGILAGGGVAGTVQSGTSLLRLGSSKLTAGTGNSIFSTLENIISAVTSILALILPIVMGVLSLIFVIWLVRKIFRLKIKKAAS